MRVWIFTVYKSFKPDYENFLLGNYNYLGSPWFLMRSFSCTVIVFILCWLFPLLFQVFFWTSKKLTSWFWTRGPLVWMFHRVFLILEAPCVCSHPCFSLAIRIRTFLLLKRPSKVVTCLPCVHAPMYLHLRTFHLGWH